MVLNAGTRLGPYEILSALGAGGMGQVYRARDTQLGRDVALKTLPEDFLHDQERLARFRREAQVLATLNHPHIAQIYGIEHANGAEFLVLEFVDGESLDRTIARGPIRLDEALAIAVQIAEALEAAHDKGIVHRDLKPANVALTNDRQVKVLDFGLAKLTEDGEAGGARRAGRANTQSPTRLRQGYGEAGDSPAMTAAGMILGTAAYMSPEQAKGRAADKRSDIWAFGCVLFEMLTGKRAFYGEDVSDTLAFVLTREPDWSALPAATPEPIRRLLRRTLQKDRQRRFESAADTGLEIEEALTSLSSDAASGSAPFRRKLWIAATAAMLIVGAVAGAWTLSHRSAPADSRVLRLQIDPPPGGQILIGPGATTGTVAISPDGRTVAYLARVNGKSGLWIRPLDASAATPLTGTDGAAYPMWAPDSQSLAFFAHKKLQRIDVAGGKPMTLADNSGPNPLGTQNGSWGSDGTVLFSAPTYGLLRVAANGGAPQILTRVDAVHGEVTHTDPQFLPRRRVLFSVTSDRPETSGMYVTSLEDPAKRIKVSDAQGSLYAPGSGGTDYLLWQRGGTLIAQGFDTAALKLVGEPRVLATETDESRLIMSVSGNGVLVYAPTRGLSQFNWVDRAGNVLAPVGEPARTFMFRLSPDDRQIALQPLRDVDLWVLDSTRGLRRHLTSGPGAQRTHPIWSPDGRTIMFGRLRGTIHRKSASGTGDEEVVPDSPDRALPTDWSGDGRWIMAYADDQKGKNDLWIVPVTPEGKLRQDDKPKPYVRTPFNERFGRFSPGPIPRWVAYQSDESGQEEIYLDAFPVPRNKIRISPAGGAFPQWRADGRELFYLSPDFKLMAVSVKETGDSIEPSLPHELFTIATPATVVSPYEISRDGQRFLVLSSHEDPSQSLNVIVNWPALLKKGVPAP